MKVKFALSLVSLATITACGGGGDSTPVPPAPTIADCKIGTNSYNLEATVCKGVQDLYKAAQDSQKAAEVDAKAKKDLYDAAVVNLKAAQDQTAAANTKIATLTSDLKKASDALAQSQVDLIASKKLVADLQVQATTNAAALVAANAAVATGQATIKKQQGDLTKIASDLVAAQNLGAAQAAQILTLVANVASSNAALAALTTLTAGQIAALQAELKTTQDALAAALAQGSGDAAAQLAQAKLLALQAAVDKAAAEKALADAVTAKAAAQQLAIQAATDRGIAAQAVIDAKAAQDAAKTDADKAAADRVAATAAAALAKADAAKAAADVVTAKADAAKAAADAATAKADAAKAAADLAEAKALSNATGLPICTYTPGTTFNWPAVGDTCVLTFTQQKQIADDIKAAAAAYKFEGVFSEANSFIVAEVGGQVWMYDDQTNHLILNTKIGKSNGTSFDAAGNDISYNHFPVTLAGTYSKDSLTATVSVDYGAAGPVKASYTETKLADTALSFTGNLSGSNAYTNEGGGGIVTMNVSADGSVSGKEGASCTFSGKLGGTMKAYEKITVTFAKNVVDPVTGITTTRFCSDNKSGSTATGVIGFRTGDIRPYVLMAEASGAFAKEGFGGYFATTANAAPATADRAQALSVKAPVAKSAGLAFLNGGAR